MYLVLDPVPPIPGPIPNILDPAPIGTRTGSMKMGRVPGPAQPYFRTHASKYSCHFSEFFTANFLNTLFLALFFLTR